MVLFLVPVAVFLLPTFLYVIIVLCLGRIMHLFSKAYYFCYKNFLYRKNKEKIPRRGASPGFTRKQLCEIKYITNSTCEEIVYGCVNVCQEREVINMFTKNLVS